MSSLSLQTEALVLSRLPPGEAFQSYTLFSPEHGNLHAMQRVPSKPSPGHVALDLFDEASVELESSNQGRTWFVKEVRLVRRRTSIGHSYEGLKLACALASVVARNPVHEESRPKVAALLRSALDAFVTGVRPDIVYLKGLYRFARDEGYPVKEDWVPSLPPAQRLKATEVLQRPAIDQQIPAEDVDRLRRNLEGYLIRSTEILLADRPAKT